MNAAIGKRIDGALNRIRRDGVIETLRYVVNRGQLAHRVREAEQIVREHNSFLFRELGVSREVAQRLCMEIRARVPVLHGDVHIERQATQSTHFLAFAALQLSGFAPRNALEIGTFRGYTTNYLAQLFPKSRIYTVALPAADPRAVQRLTRRRVFAGLTGEG
jgi:hypothetical protein